MLWFRSLLLLCILSSCHIKPLYGKQLTGLMNVMAAIDIETDTNNISQDFGFSLKKMLNPMSLDVTTQYKLKIRSDRVLSASSIRRNSEVSRYNIRLVINYDLYHVKDNKIIDSGNVSITGAYDIEESEFAVYNAKEYITKNNIREACAEIKSKLAMILLHQNNKIVQ